jgi:hypothetical protein
MTGGRSRSARHPKVTNSKFPSGSMRGWFGRLRTTGSCSHQAAVSRRAVLQAAVVVLCSCLLAFPAIAQQPPPQQDPEDERRFGLWLDETTSGGLSPNRSLEFEFHQRLDEGASNLFEYFFHGGIAFRLRQWLTVLPIYRYQRYPGDPTTSYENRLLLNVTLSTGLGRWRPFSALLLRGDFPKIALLRRVCDFDPASSIPCPFACNARRWWS